MREFPWQVYSGRNTVAQLLANADRSVVSAALGASSVQVLKRCRAAGRAGGWPPPGRYGAISPDSKMALVA